MDLTGQDTIQFLDPDGEILADLPEFARLRETLVGLYWAMVLTRAFDAKAIALQRTGRLGTYASSLGQEAVSVGTASAMLKKDVFLPSFREHGGQIWRGVTLDELFLFWGGDERGNDFTGPREDFPVCIPVATQYPQAAGVALAMSLRGTGGVAVVMGGDGSTSKGDFYEALNIAGSWSLPTVFVVANNGWAISVPVSAQTAAKSLADKALAAGIPGVQVDGNDVIAMRVAVNGALTRARDGGGPTLIEAQTYRLADHTTADDASRYRDDAEVSGHWKEEPLLRLRQHLIKFHGWTKSDEERTIRDSRDEVEAAATRYLASEPPSESAMFAYLFKTGGTDG